jgi:hypothetical protein
MPYERPLDFGGHFLPFGSYSFFKREGFSTPNGVYTDYDQEPLP